MANSLEIADYYELVALHKALMLAKFSRNPIDDRILGSPYIADIANRIVGILAEMEIERGRPELADNWQIKIVPHAEVWQIAVRNAADMNSGYWNNASYEKKKELASILLSPFVFTEEMLAIFIEEVDERLGDNR